MLFDSNIWIALTFPAHPFHPSATLARAYHFPEIGNQQAIEILGGYHELPYVDFLNEPPGIHDLWLDLARRTTASPKVWMDAYLAAFAISGELPLVTTDKDFRQYLSDGLDLQLLNPEI